MVSYRRDNASKCRTLILEQNEAEKKPNGLNFSDTFPIFSSLDERLLD